jgi:hypothetical protein
MSELTSPGSGMDPATAAAAIPPSGPQTNTSQQNGSLGQMNGTSSQQNETNSQQNGIANLEGGKSSKKGTSREVEAITAAEEFRIDEQKQVDKDNLEKQSKAAVPDSTQRGVDRRYIERNQAAAAQMRRSRQSEFNSDTGGAQDSSVAEAAGPVDSRSERIASTSAKGVVTVAAEAGKIYRRIADVSSPRLIATLIRGIEYAAIQPCKVCSFQFIYFVICGNIV